MVGIKSNKIGSNYDENYYRSNGQSDDRPALLLYERLAKRYMLPGKVLDFGCGTGALLKRLSKHFDAIGIEQSDWARTSAKKSGLTTVENLKDISSATLSGIISIHVIEHIDDGSLEGILKEWRRVLLPQSRVILATPDACGIASVWKANAWSALSDPTHINLKSHDEWRNFFQKNGFRTIKQCADGLWDFPYRYPRMGKAEAVILGWPTLFQYIVARPVLKPGHGEAFIFIVEPIS